MIELSKDKVNIITAYTDKNRFIGLNRDLPWKRSLKGDMRYINKLIRTQPNSLLIVGRTTYETMPKYKDINFGVVTSNNELKSSVLTFRNVTEAINYSRENKLYAIAFGGEKIYEEALKHSFKLFASVVEEKGLQGDRKFPKCDVALENASKEVNEFLIRNGVEKTWEFKENLFEENGFTYRFFVGESK